MTDHPAQLHRIALALVAENRMATASTRPMPTTAHNIEFAVTEIDGELLEAHNLRPQTQYERNRPDKTHTPDKELAQGIHQICSALLTIKDEQPDAQPDPWTALHTQISIILASARREWSLGRKQPTVELLQLALANAIRLATLMHLDPIAILKTENARILAKESAKLETEETGGTITKRIARNRTCACGDHYFGTGDKCHGCSICDLAEEHPIRPGEITRGGAATATT